MITAEDRLEGKRVAGPHALDKDLLVETGGEIDAVKRAGIVGNGVGLGHRGSEAAELCASVPNGASRARPPAGDHRV